MDLPATETLEKIHQLNMATQGAEKVIEMGSVVTVQFPDFQDPSKGGEIARFVLKDTPVIDQKKDKGCLYVNTPVGLAILGKKAGDVVTVELKDGTMKYDLDILYVRDATLLKQEP